jgi:hypothetical protein
VTLCESGDSVRGGRAKDEGRGGVGVVLRGEGERAYGLGVGATCRNERKLKESEGSGGGASASVGEPWSPCDEEAAFLRVQEKKELLLALFTDGVLAD